eukprot:NODE_24_length_41419_cov_0.818780.p11 type:complete len:358 gc:universal NODE_24_length_41419_cov_0.818780:29610-30683(+)
MFRITLELPTDIALLIFKLCPEPFYLSNKFYTEKYLREKYKELLFRPWQHYHLYKKPTRRTIFYYCDFIQSIQVDMSEDLYNSQNFWIFLGTLKCCQKVELSNKFQYDAPLDLIEKLRNTLPNIKELLLESFKVTYLKDMVGWKKIKTYGVDKVGFLDIIALKSLCSLSTLKLEIAGNETFYNCKTLPTVDILTINTWISNNLRYISSVFINLKYLKIYHFPTIDHIFTIDILPNFLEMLEITFLGQVQIKTQQTLSFSRGCYITVEFLDLSILRRLIYLLLNCDKTFSITLKEKLLLKKCEGSRVELVVLDQFYRDELQDWHTICSLLSLVEIHTKGIMDYFLKNSPMEIGSELDV